MPALNLHQRKRLVQIYFETGQRSYVTARLATAELHRPVSNQIVQYQVCHS